MAALVHDRIASERAAAEPPRGANHDGALLASAVPPGSAAATQRCRGGEGRPVLATMVVVALMVAGGLVVDTVSPPAPESASIGPPAAAKRPLGHRDVHVVQPGETYWSVARALSGEGDIRARVDALQASNGDKPLLAGDRLAVPVTD